MCENRNASPGNLGNEKRGGIVATKLQIATQLFGLDVYAPFFDFKLANSALGQKSRELSCFERENFTDFEAGERRVAEGPRPGEIRLAAVESVEAVLGGQHAFQLCGEDGGVDVEHVAVGLTSNRNRLFWLPDDRARR